MALDGMELAVIGVILVAIMFLGPSKIPELARAIGKAKREFKEGERGIE